MSREVLEQALDAIGSAYREHFVNCHGSTKNELQAAANAIRAELAKPAAVPDTCRQKLKKEGKPYPRSSCNFCGQLSPRWRDCDAMLYASPQPTAPAVSPVDVEAVRDWKEGTPPHPYDKEWFIALLDNEDKVVLTALPEEYSYDYKTADETYYKKHRVKKWMQFPDSEFRAIGDKTND